MAETGKRDTRQKPYVILETTYPHDFLHHLNQIVRDDLSVLNNAEQFQRIFQSAYPDAADESALLQMAYSRSLIQGFFAKQNSADWMKRVFLETSFRTLAKEFSEKDAAILLESLMFIFHWNFSMKIERTWNTSPEEEAHFHDRLQVQNRQYTAPSKTGGQPEKKTAAREKKPVPIQKGSLKQRKEKSSSKQPEKKPAAASPQIHSQQEPAPSDNLYRPLPRIPEQVKHYQLMTSRIRQTLRKALRSDAVSQCEMGDFYSEPGTPHTDYSEALAWYQHAAKNGYYRAFFEMCRLYDSQDNDIASRKEESLRIYTDLANREFPSAQYILGMKYWLGDGVASDREKAIKWLRLAAEQNHEKAIRQLADIYHAMHNEKMAQFWYKTGAKSGDAYCKQFLR